MREERGISARDMSLSLGWSEGNINNIESGKSYPSMQSFYYITEFLKVTPKEFFDYDTPEPALISDIAGNLKKLDKNIIRDIACLIEDIAEKYGSRE